MKRALLVLFVLLVFSANAVSAGNTGYCNAIAMQTFSASAAAMGGLSVASAAIVIAALGAASMFMVLRRQLIPVRTRK